MTIRPLECVKKYSRVLVKSGCLRPHISVAPDSLTLWHDSTAHRQTNSVHA